MYGSTYVLVLLKQSAERVAQPSFPFAGEKTKAKQPQAAYWSSAWGPITWLNDKIALTKSGPVSYKA